MQKKENKFISFAAALALKNEKKKKRLGKWQCSKLNHIGVGSQIGKFGGNFIFSNPYMSLSLSLLPFCSKGNQEAQKKRECRIRQEKNNNGCLGQYRRVPII